MNTLVFYPLFLSAEEYGLVVFLLATSNLLMPLIGFGVHQTIIRFFSTYKTKEEQRRFMSFVILFAAFYFPYYWRSWCDVLPLNFSCIIHSNLVIASYTWVIFVVAVATAYFEVFYVWARVQLQSVFGNALKEIFPRLYLFCFCWCYTFLICHFTILLWLWLVGITFVCLL